jgi:hypothetical protein
MIRASHLRDSATLVRGRDTRGFYDLEPRPAADLDAAARAAHADAVGRQVAALYMEDIVAGRGELARDLQRGDAA